MSAIEESVVSKIRQRSEVGLNKYGVTLERTDLTEKQWLVHAQEEAMDLAGYLEKLLQRESGREAIKDTEMPGAWVCDKCRFTLQKNVLHSGNGYVSADTSPLNEVCPNDGQLMRPLTWREVNADLFKEAITARKLRIALEKLVGASSRLELDAMRVVMSVMPDCEQKESGLCAVNALLETLPEEAKA